MKTILMLFAFTIFLPCISNAQFENYSLYRGIASDGKSCFLRLDDLGWNAGKDLHFNQQLFFSCVGKGSNKDGLWVAHAEVVRKKKNVYGSIIGAPMFYSHYYNVTLEANLNSNQEPTNYVMNWQKITKYSEGEWKKALDCQNLKKVN